MLALGDYFFFIVNTVLYNQIKVKLLYNKWLLTDYCFVLSTNLSSPALSWCGPLGPPWAGSCWVRGWDAGQPPVGEACSSLPSSNKPKFTCHFSIWRLTAYLYKYLSICSEAPSHAPHSQPLGPVQCLPGEGWAPHPGWGNTQSLLRDSSESLRSCNVKKQSFQTKTKRKRWFNFRVASWTKIKVRTCLPDSL